MAQDRWINQQLGSYKILSFIGKGGAGRVYKAQHTFLERDAAIKVLRADLRFVIGSYESLSLSS